MKRLFWIFYSLLFVGSIQAQDLCDLDIKSAIIKSEAMVPEWNPKLKKTVAQRVTFTKFTSPHPDLVQLHIFKEGTCKTLKIKSVKIFRQTGPQDWLNEKKQSSHDDNHMEHKSPKKLLKWEDKPFKVVVPKMEKEVTKIILRNVPVQEPLDTLRPHQHIWALRYEIEYKTGQGNKVGSFEVKAPLIH